MRFLVRILNKGKIHSKFIALFFLMQNEALQAYFHELYLIEALLKSKTLKNQFHEILQKILDIIRLL